MNSNINYKSDFKYTLRLLAKKPGFTLLSILVLAGGLGVSLIAVTFVDNAFYGEYLLPNGEPMYRICGGSIRSGCRKIEAFEFAQLREEITTLDNIGIFQSTTIDAEFQGRKLPQLSNAGVVEWSIFQADNVKPLLGRALQPHDHVSGAEPVVVIGFDYWKNFLEGDEKIIGKFIKIQDKSTRIVGVMPAGFRLPAGFLLWLPITPEILNPNRNNGIGVFAFATLKPDETEKGANKEIEKLMKQMRQRYPVADSDFGCRWNQFACDRGFISSSTQSVDGSLFVGTLAIGITGLTTLIFLLACLNVGTLLLARTNERLKDVSIRVALGAPRLRLLCQTMGESVVIILSGGAMALLFAGAVLKGAMLFLTSLSGGLIGIDPSLDSGTLIWAVIYLSLAVLLTSVLPCWKIVNGDFNTVMRDGTRGAVGLKSGQFSQLLVVVAIAMITILLFVGTVGMHYAWSVRSFVLDINTDNMISARPMLNAKRYSANERLQFYQSLGDSLAQDDSIESIVFESPFYVAAFEKEVADNIAANHRTSAVLVGLAGSTSTLGGVLLEGREFADIDIDSTNLTAIISRNTAAKLWPGESAIGKRIRLYDPLDRGIYPWRRVIGVVSEVASPNSLEIMTVGDAAVYLPLAHVMNSNNVAVSIKAKPGSMDKAASALRRSIDALDNQIPYFRIQRGDMMSGAMRILMNFLIGLIGGCVLFSLAVAVVGIYGLTQNSVNLLTQEMGTRRALGATDKTVSRSLLLRVGKQLLIGVGIALILILPIVGLIFVANITPIIIILQRSLVPVVVALIGLYIIMLLSIYQPIKNMLRLEPSEALRHV